ncbi:MAG: TolC family protein [Wenzhouxiangella sp.]|nr:MAG: TolC family protein [Wenzhouxiangella sp.]
MKAIRSSLISAAVLVVASGLAHAGERMSFADAMARLESSSHVLEAARFELAQARAELDQARGRRLPTVNLEGRATRLDSPLDVGVADLLPGLDGLLPPGLGPIRYEIQSEQFYNLAVEARLPLYTGGRITAGITAGQAGAEAGEAALAATRAQLHELLVQRYFGLVLAEQAVEVRAATVAGLSRHLEDATRLEEEGLIARAERLRANVALAEAERELQSAQERSVLAGAALAALLAVSDPPRPSTPIPPAPASPALAEFIEQAQRANPTLAELRSRQAQADAAVQAERGNFLPTLGAFGRRELYTGDLTLLDPDWAVGLVAQWTLFDGFQRRAKVDQAAARSDRVAALRADAERQIELLVRQRHEQLITALARLDSFSATRELAEESLRVQQRAFEEGLASSLDVIDAELALSRVRLGELDARLQAWSALAGLYAASGQSAQLPERIEARLLVANTLAD